MDRTESVLVVIGVAFMSGALISASGPIAVTLIDQSTEYVIWSFVGTIAVTSTIAVAFVVLGKRRVFMDILFYNGTREEHLMSVEPAEFDVETEDTNAGRIVKVWDSVSMELEREDDATFILSEQEAEDLGSQLTQEVDST